MPEHKHDEDSILQSPIQRRGFLSAGIQRLRRLLLPSSQGLGIGDSFISGKDDGSGNTDPFWQRADGTEDNMTGAYTDAEAIAAVEGEATLDLSGAVDVAGQLTAALGTAAAPSISFTDDPDTGAYRELTNTVAWATGGTRRMRLDSVSLNSTKVNTWKLQHSGSSASTPAYSFGSDENTGMHRVIADVLGFSTGGTDRMDIRNGEVRIKVDLIVGRSATPGATLHVDQDSLTGAKPVLLLDQADVDEDYIKIIGTSDTSADRALVDAANFTTPGSIVGWLKIFVQDDQATDPITDGDYYIPFYSVPTA